MLWIIPTWFSSLAIAALCGYRLRDLIRKVENIELAIRSKADESPEIEEPHSTFIDPTDPIQEAQYQRELMLKKMNPDA